MIRLSPVLAFAALIAACSPSPATDTDLPAADVRSGYTFLTAETQAMQDDSFANPGYLWDDRGASLFVNRTDGTPSCASCHGTGFVGVAATYPAIDETTGDLLNLEARINQCRIRHQNLPALDYESDDLLALTAFVANQSAGMPMSVSTDGGAGVHYRNGRDYFFMRRGQFNLSCHQCHDENWGKRLRGDTISQGHGNGFPAYRLEWQALGSLQRRIRDCDAGVRAEPKPFGDPTYIDLELYLNSRANDLELESPAIRR